MEAVTHPSTTQVLPVQASDEGIIPMSITLTEINGAKAMVSFWQPSEQELELISQGNKVALVIFGQVHPIVGIGVATPDVELRH